MNKNEILEKKYRILILEEDETDFLAVNRALTMGFARIQCDRARTLATLFSKTENVEYDAIIADVNLPYSTDIETITLLLEAFRHIPIVVLSETSDEPLALKVIHKGVQDFIQKKYINDSGLLSRTLRHAIERHQLKMSLEKKRDKEHYLAHFDQCTSLPNRLLFLDRLQQALIQAKRNCHKLAIFFIDLDLFKNVNDSIGHSAGDEVLRQVGERMISLIRDSDTVARFGGDEFVIMLQFPGSENSETAMNHLAQKIIKLINEPVSYGSHSCTVGASIGVSFYPRHGYSAEQLLKNADMAMYDAKTLGRNRVQFFNQVIYEKKSAYFNVEKLLRHSLCDPDLHFEVHYQPRVDLETGQIRSVEALIRWPDLKTLEYTPPDQFIPIAEDLGLIERIDEWVLEQACKKIVEWRSLNNTEQIRIGVNMSSRSFNRHNFVSQVVKPLLDKYHIDGDCLEMEITESVLLSDTLQVLGHLHALSDLGIHLAIDDFGTGFSSLSYLNMFPIDTLKIDGSFICDQQSSPSDKALLKAIVALGNALNMKVVAECIETLKQKQFLESLNCTEGQGFYFSRPTAKWEPEEKAI